MPLNATGSNGEQALLVSAIIGPPRRALTRGAAQARDVASSGSAAHSVLPDEDLRLAEFRELIVSAGATIAAEVIQHRPKADPATLIGSGKLDELSAVAASTRADVAIVDHDLSPTQLRNLENALPCRVIDRTQLILDIFARHARTREGQLQVELAQLEYMLPRLTGRGKAMSQLGGGIGTRGPGETQLETDRRRIQRRVQQLRGELDAVRRIRTQQRQRRESVPVPTVALVGYTNAGKSTLFNAITRAGVLHPQARAARARGTPVLESSRMFATLDPKLSAIQLPSRRKILLSDTVGFIRDLPHTLVTSFRATLEEVRKAEILLHVRDASSPMRDEHKAEVEKVLGELDVLDKPRLEVLNKIDRLTDEERAALAAANGRVLAVSAKERMGLEALLERVDAELVQDPILEQKFQVPQSEGDVLAALEAGTVIQHREYQGNLVRMTVAGPASLLGRYRRFRLVTREKSLQTKQTG
ncbi:MAG TPA: GTPase HflX [Acidobacteriaceae bacterium]|nr:GTPase HflX [Acidobacteriaceae bacterium]